MLAEVFVLRFEAMLRGSQKKPIGIIGSFRPPTGLPDL
jgi:hypothetical protein